MMNPAAGISSHHRTPPIGRPTIASLPGPERRELREKKRTTTKMIAPNTQRVMNVSTSAILWRILRMRGSEGSIRVKRPNHQLTDGGPPVTPESPSCSAGPPFDEAVGWP